MQIMRIKWTFNWNLFKQSTVFGPDNMKSADMNVQTGQLTRRFNGEIHVVNHNLFSNIRLPQNRNDLNSERTWYMYFSRGLLGVDWVRIRFKNYKAYKCFQFPLNNTGGGVYNPPYFFFLRSYCCAFRILRSYRDTEFARLKLFKVL